MLRHLSFQRFRFLKCDDVLTPRAIGLRAPIDGQGWRAGVNIFGLSRLSGNGCAEEGEGGQALSHHR
jgi:hypothetical protein